MTPELKYLLFSVILTFVQVVIAAGLANQAVGLTTLAGNREGLGDLPGMAGRAKRAHLNMIENMVLFIPLALMAAGKSSDMTVLGAAMFFWARLAYAIIYLVGIPWLRTACWAVSVIGMILIVKALL